jgi:hypothetical protein
MTECNVYFALLRAPELMLGASAAAAMAEKVLRPT